MKPNTYDADGNVLTRKTRAGDTIAFTYDTLDRLATKTPPAPWPAVTYGYDLAGRLKGISDTGAAIAAAVPPGGAPSVEYTTAYTYDALNRPQGVTFGPAPAAATPSMASSVLFGHSYNAANQRIGQTVSDNTWIDYPPATRGTTSYTANALNQYTAVGAVVPTYDGNGNLTSDGTYTLAYDAENRLVSASGAGNTAAYAYDGRGRRKSRTVNGATTISVTDADNREVLEYDGSTGALLRWYAYGLGPNDVLGQMNVPGNTRLAFVPDIQGSIIGVMDAGTATLTPFGYKPYGSATSTPASFGYTGQRIDTESGLYYYRARHYHPGWGRFAQVDPLGPASATNLYGYVGNDPLNFVDYTGRWQITIAAFFGIGGVVTVGKNSGQWSVGGFAGTGIGGKIQFDPNDSGPLRAGLMASGIANIDIGVGVGSGRVASVELGMTAPLGMLPSGSSYAPLEFEASAQLFSHSVGGKVGIDRRGELQFTPPQSTFGASLGGYGALGATYRWGNESRQISGPATPAIPEFGAGPAPFGGSAASLEDFSQYSPPQFAPAYPSGAK